MIALHLPRWLQVAAREDHAGERAASARADDSHPYLKLDLDACILCRRCVRACEEVQGQFVYAVEGR
ncbi:MAG TPA: hypothetical protein PKC95_09505, partial [Thauera aminoaromatica]|nr:hypothetical protein [Thauera aminoaromatica]